MAERPAAQVHTCPYCGWLDWTVEKYGRVTHKQACPHRTDPWHQGDPHPERPAANLHRYTVDTIIGPCEEWEAQDLAEAIMSLRQFSNVGGGAVGITQMEDDDA